MDVNYRLSLSTRCDQQMKELSFLAEHTVVAL